MQWKGYNYVAIAVALLRRFCDNRIDLELDLKHNYLADNIYITLHKQGSSCYSYYMIEHTQKLFLPFYLM